MYSSSEEEEEEEEEEGEGVEGGSHTSDPGCPRRRLIRRAGSLSGHGPSLESEGRGGGVDENVNIVIRRASC